MSAIKGPII